MPASLNDQMSVAEIMAHWPQVIRVLFDRRLYCVGCPIARFHTLEQAATAHGLPHAELESAVRTAVRQYGEPEYAASKPHPR